MEQNFQSAPLDPRRLADSVPPHNEEAEQAVLGVLIGFFTQDTFDIAVTRLKASDFFVPRHAQIFSAIIAMNSAGAVGGIDLLTLESYLTVHDGLETVGGIAYLAWLPRQVPTSSNLPYYVDLVYSCALRRRIIRFSSDLTQWAHDFTLVDSDLIEKAEKTIFDFNSDAGEISYNSLESVSSETYELIEDRRKNHGNITGIGTGFKRFDQTTAGFHKSEMIVLGARPGIGKTSFALALAKTMSIDRRIPVGFFTLEMPSTLLVERLISAQLPINLQKLRTGYLSPEEFGRVQEAVSQKLGDAPLYIEDTPNISLLELRAQARRMVKNEKVELIIIDYIGLISLSNKNLPRHEQVSQISRSLKALARELDIPIIVLSQVGRQTEGVEPGMADLRESGALEQDADMVVFLHRDRNAGSGQASAIEETSLIIAKNRNGPTANVKIGFQPAYATFVPLTYQ